MMMTIDFLSWLKDWLARHPLKAPLESLRASYIEEVMARIKSLPVPSPVRTWLPRPRLVLALGSVLAALLVAMSILRQRSEQLASRIDHETQVLTQLEDDPFELLLSPRAEEFDEELTTLDQLMLAEALPAVDDETWINQTLELLQRVDEDPLVNPAEGQGEAIEEELFNELHWLDETELAS